MICLPGWPTARQYARVSLAAVSIASEPPPGVKNTFASGDRHERGDPLRERLGRLAGEHLERLIARQLAHLRGGCVGELGPPVTDVAVPEAARWRPGRSGRRRRRPLRPRRGRS